MLICVLLSSNLHGFTDLFQSDLVMSSLVTTVFNSSIGWLVNKGREVTAEKLKQGDVTDQKIRDLIVREVEDIKSKLDGLSRQDLLAAVDSFETGIRYLFKALDVKPIGQVSDATAETKVKIAAENIDELSLANAGSEGKSFRRCRNAGKE